MLLVIGCAKGSASTPGPEEPSNVASSEPEAMDKSVTTEPLPLGPAGSCAVGGMAVDTRTSMPLAGATVVLAAQDKPVITDENGKFLVHSANVPEKVDVYYAELHETVVFTASACGHALRIALDTRAK